MPYYKVFNYATNLLIKISFLCFPVFLMAQVNTYSKTVIFTNDSTDERCTGVVEINGRNFIACGIYQNTDAGIGIAEIDSIGNKVRSVILSDTGKWYGVGWKGLNKTSDGHLIITGGYKDDADSLCSYCTRTVLIKLNCEGEVVWIKSLNDSLNRDQDTYGVQVIETYDHGFAVIGRVSITGILYITDSLGNLKWHLPIGIGAPLWYETVSAILELPDHGYIVGSYGKTSSNLMSGDPYIYRFDKNGNQIWKIAVGGPMPDGIPVMELINDSILMVLSSYTTKAAPFGLQEEIKLQISRLRVSDGVSLYNRIYGDSNKTYKPSQLRRYPDGSFVGCGSDMYSDLAWIIGFSENCDSLFLREFESPEGNSWYTLRNLHGITICADGGLLSVGAYFKIYNGEGNGNGWLLKTDRYGCLNTFSIVEHPQNQYVRKGETALFSMRTAGNDTLQYQWHLNDSILQGRTFDTLIINSVREADTGQYFCSVSGSCHREDSRIAELTINYTSVDQYFVEPLIAFFPNPANELVTIRVINSQLSNLSLKITDAYGRIIIEKSEGRKKDYIEKVNLQHIDSGIYFLEVEVNNRKYVRKLLKTNSK
jgi:hypothetical protein